MNKTYWEGVFKKCDGLSSYDIALYTGFSAKTVRKWAKVCNKATTVKPKNFINRIIPSVHKKIEDRKIWDNRAWMYEHYVVKQYGVTIISRLTGLNVGTIYFKLFKYGIVPRTLAEANKIRTTNKYCNKLWLMENYATRDEYLKWCEDENITPKIDGGKGMSAERLAKHIGVAMLTLYTWLVKHGIPVRDKFSTRFNKTTKKLEKIDTSRNLYAPVAKNQDFSESVKTTS